MPEYGLIMRSGLLYHGTGNEPVVSDMAIPGDRIMAIGDLSRADGRTEIDATNLAVAPGFINMLSWANRSLIQDGRSLRDGEDTGATPGRIVKGSGWAARGNLP